MPTSTLLLIALLSTALLSLAGCAGGGESSTLTSPSPPPDQSGEKSIEEFGIEAHGARRSAVVAAFKGYLNAIAAEDYGSACAGLAAAVRSSLAHLLPPKLKASGCERGLPHLLSPSAAPIARRQAEGRVTKLRVHGNRGFVVFHAPGARLYDMPIAREGSDWRVALVAPAVLSPSAETLGQ